MEFRFGYFMQISTAALIVFSAPALSGELNIQGLAPKTRTSAALEQYTQDLQSNPNAASYKNRADAYRELGMHKEAMDDIKQSLTLEPDSVLANLLQGQIYYDAGMFPEAVSSSNTVIKLDPKFEGGYFLGAKAYLKLKDYGKVLEEANTLLQAGSPTANSPVALMLRGAAYVGLKKYDLAVTDCSASIAADNKLAKSFYYRGLAYQNLGQQQKAIDDFTQALKLQPDFRPARLARAWSNYKLGKNDEAVDDCSRATQLDCAEDVEALNKYVGEKSTNPDILPDKKYNLGMQLQEELKNAITLYDDVLKEKAGDTEALRDRGVVYMHLCKYREAIRDFSAANRGLPVSPSDFPGFGSEDDYNAAKPEYQQGNADLNKGDYESAISHYALALKKYPQYARCWHNLAICFGASGDNYTAELCCVHAISYRPEDWKLWNTLGFNMFHEYMRDKEDPEKLDAASAALRQSLSLKPGSDSDRDSVSRLLDSVKNYQRALAPVSDFVVTTMPVN